ncbi:YgfZ/GcvT domain-containing protein [Azospira restricta]|uniref:Folate-binding protein YgfZ n=1 Tax=Azospira restricta TaxID=404405 RepID=A0A974PWZ6_9RHOO|nr:folate-binding protein YgfZ [Azospira restricta]QRJ62779.1 folate-binding protein YgfZ [Azospira restricta]
MIPTWKEALGATGARFNDSRNPEVDSFGDAAGELAAARDATVVAPLTHLGVIRVGGEDAKSFLHNQLTSDINHLAADGAQHAAWCSAKGRMLASFVVWRDGGDYLLALSADLQAAIAKRLQMYVLRSKVTVADAGLALLGLSGPQSPAALQAAGLPRPEPMKSAAADGCAVIRIDDARQLIAVPAERAAAVWAALAGTARPVGLPAWRWLDIRAALPLISEATKEHFVPQMANFERIGGVSFHKGCYPGQEVVARTQYLGKVKRHLYRLRSDAAMAAGDELYSEAVPDQSCGMVVSAAASPAGGHEALAVVMELAADAGIRLRARDGANAAAAAVAA